MGKNSFLAGWEKAESEAAEFKAELENATKLRLDTEDRARHLDGTLKELMQQLRGGRDEADKHLHETIVKKTREFDKLRLEMEAKLAEVTKSMSDNRTQLIESQAENEALNHALKVCSSPQGLSALSFAFEFLCMQKLMIFQRLWPFLRLDHDDFQDRSRMIAELNDIKAHAETDNKILRVRVCLDKILLFCLLVCLIV